MKKLLYTTDLRKASASALQYAFQFSKAIKANLHLLHIFDLLPIVSSPIRSRDVNIKNYRIEQQELLKIYCARHLASNFDISDLQYHTLRNESISKAVIQVSESIDADLVMVGTSKPNSLRGFFSENIANELMSQLDCPLLILPEDIIFRGLSNLLYATDFEESDIQAIQYLVQIAEPFGAKIEIVHIPRKKEYNFKKKMQLFKETIKQKVVYPELVFASETAQDVESGIHHYIDIDNPEMLVMLERERLSFWQELWHKDLVKKMEFEIGIPLMVFNKKSFTLKLTGQSNYNQALDWT